MASERSKGREEAFKWMLEWRSLYTAMRRPVVRRQRRACSSTHVVEERKSIASSTTAEGYIARSRDAVQIFGRALDHKGFPGQSPRHK